MVSVHSSALNAGAKRSGQTWHVAMPQCFDLAKGAKRPSHTTDMLTSLKEQRYSVKLLGRHSDSSSA